MKKRINYIDIARGLAVIAVVIGHIQPSLCPTWLTAWVYSFHLPLFFILSGILINVKKYKTFGSFAKKTAKTLLLQYLILSLIVFFIDCGKSTIKGGGIDIVATLKQFSGIAISWRHTEFYNSLWFIPAIALAEFVAYPIIKYSEQRKRNWIPLSFSALIFWTAGSLFLLLAPPESLPWGIDILLIIVPFILFGQILRPFVFYNPDKFKPKLLRSLATIAILLAFNILLCIANYYIVGQHVDMYYDVLGNTVIFLASALTGSAAILLISRLIKTSPLIEKVGSRSIIYYAFQTLAFPIAKAPVLFAINKVHLPESKFISALVITLLTCTALSIISVFLEKILPSVFSKPYACMLKSKDRNGTKK